jgi:hypothetical protein
MQKLLAIIKIFISFNVFGNNMKPLQINVHEKDNIIEHKLYINKINSDNIAA